MAQTRFSSEARVTGKVGSEDKWRSTGFKQVTQKVGSVDIRDLSIRKPQMKVGKADFIDTYSPF